MVPAPAAAACIDWNESIPPAGVLRTFRVFFPMLREGSVRFPTMRTAVLAALLVGCASGGPRQYGQYTDLAPMVKPQPGERVPQHVTVQLARPANVAVFLVMPG